MFKKHKFKFLAVFIILLIAGGGTFYFMKKKKEKEDKAAAEQEKKLPDTKEPLLNIVEPPTKEVVASVLPTRTMQTDLPQKPTALTSKP